MTLPTPDARWLSPPRSLLFVPGDRVDDLLDKALGSGADGVILDLEDAVAPEAKASAREAVVRRLERTSDPPVPILVRINAAGSPWHDDDLRLASRAAHGGVMLPKVEVSAALEAVRATIEPQIPLIPIVETPRGILAAAAICATPGIVGVAFGAVDFAAALGSGAATTAGAQIDHARLHLVLAAAAASIWTLDGPCIALDDRGVLEREADAAVAAGCSGKLAIHPAQIGPIHRALRPAPAEVARAREILDRVSEMAERISGAGRAGGLMIDEPVAIAARRILALEARYEREDNDDQ